MSYEHLGGELDNGMKEPEGDEAAEPEGEGVAEPENNEEEIPLSDKKDAQRWYKIDDVLEHFGTIGKFQIVLIMMTSMLAIIAAWRILMDLFAAKTNAEWWCTDEGIKRGCRYEEGKMPCTAYKGDNRKLEDGHLDGKTGVGIYWQFNESYIDNSIRSSMKLPCSENWKFSFTSSIYFVGAFFGVWMYGRLSDMIGRRKSCMISLGMCVAQAWIIPFFNNINVYLACRFFDGAAFGGFFLIVFVLEIEYAPPKYRNTLGTAFHFITSMGMAAISIWGVLLKQWKWYCLALAIPPTIMLPVCYFFMPESPRYYLSKGKDEKALKLLRKVAKVNKSADVPEGCQLYEDIDVKTSCFQILKNRKLVGCALINMLGWFMTSLVYYMLWFSAKYLAGNIYINAAILGLAELPGRVMAYFMMEKIGRRKTFMGAMGLACVCMFISIWDNSICRKVMYCMGKALAGTLWAVIYLYSSEMYPTRIRNLGSGIGSAAARVAALIAPFIGEWLNVSPVIPYIIVGVLAIISCGTFFFVPETSGKDLPQTLEEFNMLFDNYEKPKKDDDEEMELHKSI